MFWGWYNLINKFLAYTIFFLFLGINITSSTGDISKIYSAFKFNNPPYEPSNPFPSNGTLNMTICPLLNLSWTGGDPDGDNVTYDGYFGKYTPPQQQIIFNQTFNFTYLLPVLDFNTTYYWKIVAWDIYGASTEGPIWSFTTEENLPPNPAEDPHPIHGDPAVPLEDVILEWNGSDPNLCDSLYYDVYFDDVNPPVTKQETKQPNDWWAIPYSLIKYKNYYWQIVTWDSGGLFTEGPIWNFTTGDNFPPTNPIIDGPNHGVKNKEYNFTFNSTDPENHTIRYHVKWGDGKEYITDYHPSGEVVKLSHSWDSDGAKKIEAKAIDEHNAESDWSTFEIIMPRNKIIHYSLFLKFLDRFTLIQRLLDFLGVL